MSNELSKVDNKELSPIAFKMVSIKENAELLHSLMKEIMKDGEHFGVIPGTNKPSLYKSGAEKLCFTFRLAPTFSFQMRSLENGHREYEVVCTLTAIESGLVLGSGVGLCTTMESKYRYRDEKEVVYIGELPADYSAKKDDYRKQGKIAQKDDSGAWGFYSVKRTKKENPDIADVYNTVLKMAKKRAFVDAVLQATAASDIFTQDVEDFFSYESVTPIKNVEPEKEIPLSTPVEKVAIELGKEVPKEIEKEFWSNKIKFKEKYNAEIFKGQDGIYRFVEIGHYEKMKQGTGK